jgi:O-antigen ligase
MAVFLFVAPFPASAGLRAAMLLLPAAMMAAAAIVRRDVPDFRRLPRGFAIALLAWIAWSVASLGWTHSAAYTAEELRRELFYGMLAFTVCYAGTTTMRVAHVAIVAALAGTMLLGLAEWVRHFFPALPYAARYESAQGPFSTHITLVAPLLAMAAWPRPVGLGCRGAVVALLAAGLLLAGLATENRMLWVALAVGAIVAFAVFHTVTPHGEKRARMRHALLGSLAVIAIAITASAQYKAARYYPGAKTLAESIASDQRPRVWATAARLFAEKPLIGYGFGREIVGDAIEESVSERHSQARLRHGHNVFLDVGLQLGVVGLAIFATLIATLAIAFARVRGQPGGAPITITGLSLLAAFIVKNLTDDFYYRPASLVFWALCGMLLGLAARAPSSA